MKAGRQSPTGAAARALRLAALALLAAAGAAARADDRAELDQTRIVGNRELPKVLYIVPWRKPLLGEAGGRPLRSAVEEALEPLDRDVFRRSVRYDEQLRAAAPQAQLAPAAPPPPPAR
jgi:hypothetical protein